MNAVINFSFDNRQLGILALVNTSKIVISTKLLVYQTLIFISKFLITLSLITINFEINDEICCMNSAVNSS